MEQTYRNTFAIVLIIAVLVFTILALLAIWDILYEDIIWKSLSTLAVLVISSALIFVLIRIMNDRSGRNTTPSVIDPEESD